MNTRNIYIILVEISVEKRHLRERDLVGSMILKWIIKKQVMVK